MVVMAGEKLYRVASIGADPVLLPTHSNFVPRHHALLPDGRHLLASNGEDIVVVDMDGQEAPRSVVKNGVAPSFAGGHLFFLRSDTLYAQPFDAAKITVSGQAQSIAKIQTFGETAAYAVADDSIVYLPSGSELLTALQRVDRTGKVLATIVPPAYFFSPRLSGDGLRIAVDQSVSEGPGDIWIFDVRDGHGSRFTFSAANESAPVWSAADREIAYFAGSGTSVVTMRKRVAGGQPVQAIHSPDTVTYTGDWSAADRWFVTTSVTRPGLAEEIVTYALPSWSAAAGVPRIPGRAPRISPDSKWLAYESCDGGRCEVFVDSMPPTGSKWQVSVDGGTKPVWSRDGKSLCFMNAAGKLVESAVATAADGSFNAQVPQPLFQLRMRELDAQWAQYDVFPDGTFLVNRIPDNATSPMTAILNWRAALAE
jgi:hypothetical protein